MTPAPSALSRSPRCTPPTARSYTASSAHVEAKRRDRRGRLLACLDAAASPTEHVDLKTLYGGRAG